MPIAFPVSSGQLTWHFSCATGAGDFAVTCGVARIDDADPEGLTDAAGNAWIDNMSPRHANIVKLIQVTGRWNAGGDDMIVTEAPFAANGTGGADVAPLNTAVLVRKTSVLAGRQNKGRFYVPGVVMGDLTANTGATLATSPLVGWVTACSGFYEDLVSAGAQPVILHQEPATTWTQVTGFVPQARLATQRGRLRD